MNAFSRRGVEFVLHLGDIIDGRQLPDRQKGDLADPERQRMIPKVLDELDEVLGAFSLLGKDVGILHSRSLFLLTISTCLDLGDLPILTLCHMIRFLAPSPEW